MITRSVKTALETLLDRKLMAGYAVVELLIPLPPPHPRPKVIAERPSDLLRGAAPLDERLRFRVALTRREGKRVFVGLGEGHLRAAVEAALVDLDDHIGRDVDGRRRGAFALGCGALPRPQEWAE